MHLFARTETPISEDKLLIYQDKRSLLYQEIFSEDYRPIEGLALCKSSVK
jgi:hypothetical protein